MNKKNGGYRKDCFMTECQFITTEGIKLENHQWPAKTCGRNYDETMTISCS
jgi:hypothetical protein